MGKAILVGSHSLFISGSFSASLFSIAYFKALLTSSNDSVSIIHIGATFWIFFIALYYLFEPVFEYFVCKILPASFLLFPFLLIFLYSLFLFPNLCHFFLCYSWTFLYPAFASFSLSIFATLHCAIS